VYRVAAIVVLVFSVVRRGWLPMTVERERADVSEQRQAEDQKQRGW
jgi:hypothetical protein